MVISFVKSQSTLHYNRIDCLQTYLPFFHHLFKVAAQSTLHFIHTTDSIRIQKYLCISDACLKQDIFSPLFYTQYFPFPFFVFVGKFYNCSSIVGSKKKGEKSVACIFVTFPQRFCFFPLCKWVGA